MNKPIYKGLVKGVDGDYMVLEIYPEANGEHCMKICAVGSREEMEAAYRDRYGEDFVWGEPLLKIVDGEAS